MHASWKRAVIARAARSAVATSFLTAGLASALVAAGCGRDSDAADRTLRQKVAAVQPRIGSVEDRKLEVQELQKAIQVQGTSDAAKVNASMRLADAEVAVGDALAHEVEDREIDAARLGGEIRALTAQIRANNVAVAGYRAMEPKPAQQTIDEQKDAAAKGKENGLWISDGASPIPAQQTVAAEIDRLNKEIADLQQKRTALETEQTQATQQADKLTEGGNKAKGQQALDMGIEAAELRKKSRDSGAQMEAIDLQINHDQQDLKIAQSRQAAAAETIKALDAHKGELDATWSQVSDRMKAQTTMSQKLLGEEGAGGGNPGGTGAAATPAAAPSTPSADATGAGGATAGGNGAAPASRPVSAAEMEALARQNTIAVKAQRIAELVSEAADRRREALDSYSAARRHVNEAQQAAAKMDAELARLINDQKNRTASERPAWDQMREALTANRFTFRQAMIDDKEAAVHATAAAGLQWRADLKNELQSILQVATLTPPAVIDAKPFGTADEAKAEREAAQAGYKDAEDKLASIDSDQATPTKQDIGRAARAMLATTQYARSQFLARIGDTAAADQARKTAIDTIKQIKEENWPLPAVMAPELAEAAGITPIAPTTRPGATAAGPTTGPATAASDTPEQAAVRQVAANFANALYAGDTAGAQNLAVADPVTTQLIATLTRVMGAFKKVHDAMVSKFGEQANPIVSALPDIRAEVASAPVTITGDTAKLVKGGESLFDLRQVNGQWKIDRPDEKSVKEAAAFDVLAATLEMLGSDIAGGKYNTLAEAATALQQALQQAAPGVPATAPATAPATEPNPTAPPTAAPDAATAPPTATPTPPPAAPPTTPPPAANPTTPPPAAPTTPPPAAPTTPPPAAPTTPPPAAPTTPPPAAPTTPPPAAPTTPPPAANPNTPPPAAPVNK